MNSQGANADPACGPAVLRARPGESRATEARRWRNVTAFRQPQRRSKRLAGGDASLRPVGGVVGRIG